MYLNQCRKLFLWEQRATCCNCLGLIQVRRLFTCFYLLKRISIEVLPRSTHSALVAWRATGRWTLSPDRAPVWERVWRPASTPRGGGSNIAVDTDHCRLPSRCVVGSWQSVLTLRLKTRPLNASPLKTRQNRKLVYYNNYVMSWSYLVI